MNSSYLGVAIKGKLLLSRIKHLNICYFYRREAL